MASRRDLSHAEAAMIDPDVACVVSELEWQLDMIASEAAALHESVQPRRGSTQHALAGIDRSIAAMRRVILDVLDLEAVESGGLTLARGRCELDAVLSAAIRQVANPRIACLASAPVRMSADAQRLTRAFATLLRVALATSVAGSSIIARAERRLDRAVVSLLVVGAACAGRLTELLTRAHAPQPHWDAEQLALYIARHTIDMHGGVLGAEYMPELGSRIYVELPIT